VTTYFYIVTSDYGVYGTAESEQVMARPLKQSPVVAWGPSENLWDSTRNATITFDFVTNGVRNLGSTDISPLIAGDEGPPLYGIIQALNCEGANMRIRGINDTPDRFTLPPKASNPIMAALIYVKSEDLEVATFNPDDGDTYTYSTTLATKGNTIYAGGGIHAALRSSVDGQWYISESLVDGSGETLLIPDVTEEKWVKIAQADQNSTSLMTVTNATFSTVSSWDDIDQVGWFCDYIKTGGYTALLCFSGQVLTPLQLWSDDEEIYNTDAAPDADPDGDGVVNLLEWGLAGVPTDSESTGTAPRLIGVDGTGTNLVYRYPRKVNDPKPAYTVVESGDLFLGFSDNSATYTETGTGPNVGGTGGQYVWVTNTIPMDLDAKFIDLDVQEP
jgi:hypothetical protein